MKLDWATYQMHLAVARRGLGLAVAFEENLHPRGRGGKWKKKMYHAGWAEDQASILSTGLQPADPGASYTDDAPNPEGVYLYHDRKDAEALARSREEPNVVYEVDATDLPIEPDPMMPKGSAVIRGAIPPERIRVAEMVEPKDWTPPPPPVGKKGEGKAGGYSSDKAFGTNTTLGRVGEQAFVDILGGEILHPEGKGEQSPLDVRYGDYGFEVKAVSTKSQGYKATPKPHEIGQKEAFAQQLGLKPALAIVVIDSDTGEAHAYFREGLAGGRLSQNTGWQYLGSKAVAAV